MQNFGIPWLSDEILLLILVISVLEMGLLLIAVLDWRKQPKNMPNRYTWLGLIFFVNFFGPITYFWIAPRNSGKNLEFDDQDDEEKEFSEYKG